MGSILNNIDMSQTKINGKFLISSFNPLLFENSKDQILTQFDITEVGKSCHHV